MTSQENSTQANTKVNMFAVTIYESTTEFRPIAVERIFGCLSVVRSTYWQRRLMFLQFRDWRKNSTKGSNKVQWCSLANWATI